MNKVNGVNLSDRFLVNNHFLVGLNYIVSSMTLLSVEPCLYFLSHFSFSPLVCRQERLLLSLLPAHIARVMKAEIIQRLKGPNFGQMENTNNFHNLYVQRHTNVRHVVLVHKVTFTFTPL